MTIKAIAIDDESGALDVIKYHSNKIPFIELSNSFRNPFQAIEYLNNHPIDLIFLDINMPDISGIQFLKTLNNRPPMVIFTTAYSSYAVESYDLNAVDYLVKPIQLDRFTKAVNKARNLMALRENNSINLNKKEFPSLFIKAGTELKKIESRNILFVKSEGNYMEFHTNSGKKLLSRMTVKEALEELPNELFIQVHRSYIVNTIHIQSVKKDVLSVDQFEIPVGTSYFKKILEKVKAS